MEHNFLRKIRPKGAARHSGMPAQPAVDHLPHGSTMTRHFGEHERDPGRKFPGGPKPPQPPVGSGWRKVKRGQYGA